MYCPNCGKQLREGAKFCGFCGMDLSGRPEPHPRPAGGGSGANNKKYVPLLIIAGCVLAALFALLGSVPKKVLACKASLDNAPLSGTAEIVVKGTGKKPTKLEMVMTYTTGNPMNADSTYEELEDFITDYMVSTKSVKDILKADLKRKTRGGLQIITLTAEIDLKKIKSEEIASDLNSFNSYLRSFFDYVYYENIGAGSSDSAKNYLKNHLTGYGFSCE